MNSNIPIFDGHNDVLLNLLLPERGGGRSFFERGKRGHLDLPRAVEGGFGGGFFACFVPPDPADGWSLAAALTMKEDGYEVEMAPPVDASYARRFTRVGGTAKGRDHSRRDQPVPRRGSHRSRVAPGGCGSY